MKTAILIVIISCSILVSCYKPYNGSIETDKKILIVDGLITNEKASYNIHLTYALPFDSSGPGQPVQSAHVHITDAAGNYFPFVESDNGNYVSDPMQFTGHPGNTYTLHITTYDGEIYESDPQQLNPCTYPDSVYAEFNYEETLNKISGLTVLSYGADILTDIRNKTGTLPHFRFTTNLLTLYVNAVSVPFSAPIVYYCWQTENANQNINLTGGEYLINSTSENKHAVCFIEDNIYCFSSIYYQAYIVNSRIIYLNQYALNNEAYLYYRKIDEVLRSEGKLFDPIALKLDGNIKCTGDPSKKAFGFFEAASISYNSYKVDFRKLINSQPSITKIPYILPLVPKGSNEGIAPPFWVN